MYCMALNWVFKVLGSREAKINGPPTQIRLQITASAGIEKFELFLPLGRLSPGHCQRKSKTAVLGLYADGRLFSAPRGAELAHV